MYDLNIYDNIFFLVFADSNARECDANKTSRYIFDASRNGQAIWETLQRRDTRVLVIRTLRRQSQRYLSCKLKDK